MVMMLQQYPNSSPGITCVGPWISGEVVKTPRNEKSKFQARKSMLSKVLKCPEDSTLFPVISQDGELGIGRASEVQQKEKGN